MKNYRYMPSLCLSCLLFTLEDKPVEENKYIDIFNFFFSQVLKSGELKKGDAFALSIDKRTFDYIKSHNTTLIFGHYGPYKFPFEILIHVFTPPKTLLEGMMKRYYAFSYTQDIYMYCDIDIFIIKPLSNLTDHMKPNTIYIHNEKSSSIPYDSYHANMPKNFVIIPGTPCVSSGKFAIYGKELLVDFFTKINNKCNYNTKYNTVDQPFFNHAILHNLHTMPFDISVFNNENICFSFGNINKDTTILLDCAGDAGNGELHYKTMLRLYILLHCDFIYHERNIFQTDKHKM